MPDVREAMMNLSSALGIDLSGLADDVLETCALRIVAEGILPTKPAIQRVIDEARRAEGSGQEKDSSSPEQTSEEPALPSAHPFRFNATEADSIQRRKLAAQHLAETRRTGLYIVPRRPEVMPTSAVHPACWAAYNDGGTPCSVCIPRLHPAVCPCEVCDRWWAETEG